MLPLAVGAHTTGATPVVAIREVVVATHTEAVLGEAVACGTLMGAVRHLPGRIPRIPEERPPTARLARLQVARASETRPLVLLTPCCGDALATDARRGDAAGALLPPPRPVRLPLLKDLTVPDLGPRRNATQRRACSPSASDRAVLVNGGDGPTGAPRGEATLARPPRRSTAPPRGRLPWDYGL